MPATEPPPVEPPVEEKSEVSFILSLLSRSITVIFVLLLLPNLPVFEAYMSLKHRNLYEEHQHQNFIISARCGTLYIFAFAKDERKLICSL